MTELAPAVAISELRYHIRQCRWVLDHQPTLGRMKRDALGREIAISEMAIARLAKEMSQTDERVR